MRRGVPLRRAGTHDALMGPGSAAHHARKRGALHPGHDVTTKARPNEKQARDADLLMLRLRGQLTSGGASDGASGDANDDASRPWWSASHSPGPRPRRRDWQATALG